MAHFLRKMELNGFKSFASRTVLEFPDGITAVVGPNGSGKSNVVDAIRWLLGERDARSLRGAKIDDLIFAGTPKRARLGQAQASLHFDNSSGFFPVDYSEVAIMRQIDREGNSKYFLNKSEILLRDLVDFFARARLGSKGLIVVTQGNSDMFITASPTARREMIEEILGLREYQLKKTDAVRRLKNTKINLEKARALIDEILPHMRSLKRQAGRWERRGFLEEELKKLEDTFFGGQFNALTSSIRDMEKKIEMHEKLREGFEAEKQKAESRRDHVEAVEPAERKRLREIKDETQELFAEREKIQKGLGKLETQIEIAMRPIEIPVAEHDASAASELVRRLRTRLEIALNDDAGRWREIISKALEEIEEFLAGPVPKKEYAAHPAADISPWKKEFEALGGELRKLDDKVRKLKEDEIGLEKSQEAFYHKYKEAVAQVEHAKQQLENWNHEHGKLQFEKERLDLRLEELARYIEQAGRKAEEFARYEGAVSQEHELREMEHRIFKLRGDLASIGEIDEALVKEAKETEARYEFLNTQAGDLEKATGDLRTLIIELKEKISGEFSKSLGEINREFQKFFEMMFGGGHAKLKLASSEKRVASKDEKEESEEGNISESRKAEPQNGEEEEDDREEGVEITLGLPRKKLGSLEVLSGGERSLVGIAAVLALISVSPPPFLVLDEVDAPLDERNARRFAELLKEFSKKTQFVLVTHNRATMEAADVLYGITLDEEGVSQVVSLKFEEVKK